MPELGCFRLSQIRMFGDGQAFKIDRGARRV